MVITEIEGLLGPNGSIEDDAVLGKELEKRAHVLGTI